MSSALAIDLPASVSQKHLIEHFSEGTEDDNQLLYVLHPFGSDKKTAVVAFKNAECKTNKFLHYMGITFKFFKINSYIL